MTAFHVFLFQNMNKMIGCLANRCAKVQALPVVINYSPTQWEKKVDTYFVAGNQKAFLYLQAVAAGGKKF